jgi:hypothetical protein
VAKENVLKKVATANSIHYCYSVEGAGNYATCIAGALAAWIEAVETNVA